MLVVLHEIAHIKRFKFGVKDYNKGTPEKIAFAYTKKEAGIYLEN